MEDGDDGPDQQGGSSGTLWQAAVAVPAVRLETAATLPRSVDSLSPLRAGLGRPGGLARVWAGDKVLPLQRPLTLVRTEGLWGALAAGSGDVRRAARQRSVKNSGKVPQAVFAFRRYEDPSLRYTGIESHEGPTHYGLYDTVVARE